MLNKTYWTADNQPALTTLDCLMNAIRNDDMQAGLLYDAPTLDDILSSETKLSLDGIVVQNVRLKAKMLAMKRVMNQAASDAQKIDGEPMISDPFTRLGSANVAVLFPLKDGQAITVYLHNPDTTPRRISPTDVLISYKFLLNKKDVTIVVAPERGQEIDIRQVGVRLMRLAEKNSAAFQRQNAKTAERRANVAKLTEERDQKQAQLAEKVKEIEALEALKAQQEADLALAQQAQSQAVEEPISITGKEFGEFDIDSEAGKAQLRKAVREYLENNLKGKWIKNKALNREIEIRQRGIDEMLYWSANPQKLQIAAAIEQVIATAKPKDNIEPWEGNVKKDKKRHIEGYYRFTNSVSIAGEKISFDVLIEQDEKGLLHYDFILPKRAKAIMDNVGVAPDTYSGKDQQTITAFATSDNNAVLDNASSGYVLNLFIFDENGNEIKDDEEIENQPNAEPKQNFDEKIEQIGEKLQQYGLLEGYLFEGKKPIDLLRWKFRNPLIVSAEVIRAIENEPLNDFNLIRTVSEANIGEFSLSVRIALIEYYGIELSPRAYKETWQSVIYELFAKKTGKSIKELEALYEEQGAELKRRQKMQEEQKKQQEEQAKQEKQMAKKAEYDRLNELVDGYLDEFEGIRLQNVISKLIDKSTNPPQLSWQGEKAFEISRSAMHPHYYYMDGDYYLDYEYQPGRMVNTRIGGRGDVSKTAVNFALWLWDKKSPNITLTGKEFGEFDLSTAEGKKALREKAFEHLSKLARTKKWTGVYCRALNAEVRISSSGVKKYKQLSANPVKSLVAAKIEEIIARGKRFKESQKDYSGNEKLTYHYLKTAVNVEDKEYGVRVVIREDGEGHYHYDLQLNESVEAILDSVETEKGEIVRGYKATVSHLSEGQIDLDEPVSVNKSDFSHQAETQLDLEANNTPMLDNASSGYVLNLFIFDEHGNEIKDDEEPEQAVEEPISITGKEFGEFDLSTAEGKKALREKAFEHLSKLAENGEKVFCSAVNNEVGFNKAGAKKFKSLGGNPIKNKLAIAIKQIIKNSELVKKDIPSYDLDEQKRNITYSVLKTKVMVDNKEYGVRIVLRKLETAEYQYDMQLRGNVDLIVDSSIENELRAARLTKSDVPQLAVANINSGDTANLPNKYGESHITSTQRELQADNTLVFDDVSSGYVLNLFVFDEHGNLIPDESDEMEVQEAQNASLNPVTEELIRQLDRKGVEYRPVQPLSEPLSTDSIIQKLAGGDETKGSCASLALAYIGNRIGLDVTDYRGGKSREFFSRVSRRIASIEGVKSTVVRADVEFSAALDVLQKHVEIGKEYYFAAGKHAAIIRRTAEKGYEYLEMQDRISSKNGWHKLKRETLERRFECKTKPDRMKIYEGGYNRVAKWKVFQKDAVLMEVDSFNAVKVDFQQILGYLNTAPDKQKKGDKGWRK